MTALATAGRWTPPPTGRKSQWWISLLVTAVVTVAVVVAAVQGHDDRGASPDPSPTTSLPGLFNGETFSLASDTELWVSGVLITAHSGSDSATLPIASYSVSGPGFTTIDVWDSPKTVITIPGWGQLTAEKVDAERHKDYGGDPPAVLHFRAVTDFPLEIGSQDFPAKD